MEKEKEKKTITDKVWDLFASVKLAIIIFSLIALTSIVGTIVEQQAEPERNLKLLAKMFGESSAPTIYSVLDSLGFMNMYHSWWFVGLLLLFAANLIICSFDRLPRVLKMVNEKVRPLPPEHLEKMSIKKAVSLKGKASQFRELGVSALNDIGFKPLESSGEQGTQFYAEKGNFTRLGVYITHLSILIILAGAIIGIFFGFNAFLNLPEGETSSVAFQDRGVEVPLGFALRCDNFEVDYYPNSDMPKAYRSWLTVIKNGREVMKKSIVVNDPLVYEGITFYQASYGPVPNAMGNGIFILKLISKNGNSEQVQAKLGDSFAIPGTSVRGKIVDFSPALSIDPSGRAFTYADQLVNPAVAIEFSDSGEKKFSGWLLKRYPKTWDLPDGNRVEFMDYWGVEYTGMQVRKDPGVWIVYLGCFIMAAGLYITFFMSHKRVWVNISEDKNEVKVLIGASANRNRAAFEHKIEKLAGLLSAGPKGGK
ncbi:MAG: cytochrome c biogenesis protein ResB [Nitrospirota bacterium]|nr:cytochrome c biogenesis protein ResB [Nitrospirota bacterium]